MNKTIKTQKNFLPVILAILLVFLIVCPVVMIFAKAVIVDGRLDFYLAWVTV